MFRKLQQIRLFLILQVDCHNKQYRFNWVQVQMEMLSDIHIQAH